MDTNDRWTLGAALVAFLAVLGAFVVLTITNHDGQAVTRMVVELGALFGFGAYSHRNHRTQRRKLDKIEHQTNGAMDARIRTQTRLALSDMLEDHLDPHERGNRR